MSQYWVCRQDANDGHVWGWVGPTADRDTAIEWAKFYTKHQFNGSCSLATVVEGNLGEIGDVVAEFLLGQLVPPDDITMQIPTVVQELRPPF